MAQVLDGSASAATESLPADPGDHGGQIFGVGRGSAGRVGVVVTVDLPTPAGGQHRASLQMTKGA